MDAFFIINGPAINRDKGEINFFSPPFIFTMFIMGHVYFFSHLMTYCAGYMRLIQFVVIYNFVGRVLRV